MVAGKATVSERIKGRYGVGRPSSFTSVVRPVVFWNITYSCNLRCSHCYIDAGRPRPELPAENVVSIADQLADHGVPLVVFTGGEPVLSKLFWKAAERLAGYERPKLALSTNGTLLTRDVVERLRRLGFTYIGVSLDSADPAKHDAFRGVRGAFSAALQGIRNAIDAGLDVGIRITITRDNVAEVRSVLELAKTLGVRRVSVYVLDTIGRGRELAKLLPSPDQLRAFVDELMELARTYADYLEVLLVRANFAGVYIASKLARNRGELIEYLKLVEAQGDCGRKTASIYPDGTVRPCQFLETVIGDLKREKLVEILSPDNPRLKPFLEIHRRLRGPRCSQCPFRRVCGGGSRNRALVVNGDFWGDDPLCFIDFESLAERFNLPSLL
jgi:radical SAM protein with 4Fe4S-binding SPASM domain